ncbi:MULTISPECIES: N-acetylneuraminate synthase family protein [Bacillaceae]|uniref:N-acetylneuraminate synthase family protein n=1 Tax=Evansella alkalicola TaxID=745819 RepID=A0ABS6JZD5_9BACI|nr:MULTISPECIES: N-acetylneuraminate synthase family protein [Bacillaceae]MBU9723451.1 N-acetylneuraminate synthase family protein [Bacillus alkalicola]
MTNPFLLKSSPYLIAETAYIHEGDQQYLLKLIQETKGFAHAIKFHLLTNLDQYMTSDHNLYPVVKNWVFNKNEWSKILKEAKRHDLDVICLLDDMDSVDILDYENCDAVSIHGTSINDIPLLDRINETSFPVFISLSGVNTTELERTIDHLKSKQNREIYLMYGYQNYPTDVSKIELSKIKSLSEYFQCPVGYADHTEWDSSLDTKLMEYAYIYGCRIFEKHITVSPGVKRVDYESSVHPKRLKGILENLSFVETVTNKSRFIPDDQLTQRQIGPMKKALVSNRHITKGQIIREHDLGFKRTSVTTLQDPYLLYFSVIGKKANFNLDKDELITSVLVDH